jgi:hypothetical protein
MTVLASHGLSCEGHHTIENHLLLIARVIVADGRGLDDADAAGRRIIVPESAIEAKLSQTLNTVKLKGLPIAIGSTNRAVEMRKTSRDGAPAARTRRQVISGSLAHADASQARRRQRLHPALLHKLVEFYDCL